MDHRLSVKFRWHLKAGLAYLGWPGSVGLGLLALCLTVYLVVLLPAQDRLTNMRTQVSSLHAQLAKNQAMKKATSAPEDNLPHFYQFFPAHVATPDMLGKLYAAAADAGIALEQGEYRPETGKGDKLDRYQITLPVTGSYPQIRKFIARLLADLPAISLDGVSLQRQKISDMQVESQIKLTLYLGGGA